ncbi:MAG: LysR family transcriptional regulator [Firmicutes bacterium]|nr:LysR family transcriptional regulator [Bacillota bacterium]
MNDIQITNFISIAKLGSFSKAEEALSTTKTALKKQMDSLENDLGFKLFSRTPRGLTLTKAGEYFFREVSVMYGEFQTLVQDCRTMDRSAEREIRIGMYTITSMINWYHSIEENSSFTIRPVYITEGIATTHEENLAMLIQNKIDFLEYEDNALIFEHHLCFHRIAKDHLSCVMKTDHPLADHTCIHPQDLAGFPVFFWTSRSSATRSLSELSISYNLNLQTIPYSTSNVLNACTSGGIYILSNNLASKFRPLKVIPIDPPINYYRGLVYKPEKADLLQEMLQIAEEASD